MQYLGVTVMGKLYSPRIYLIFHYVQVPAPFLRKDVQKFIRNPSPLTTDT